MKEEPMTRTQDKYIVRLPDGWRDAIKARAARRRGNV
ncbi:Arc family DNA-binding protein [Cereibacter johrii]